MSYTNASVKTATEQFHGADLSTDSLVTLDFFRMVPLHVQPVMPKAKYNVKYGSEIRVAPLVKPMFGNMQATYRSYFVPYRVIFEHWNAFITDSVENNIKVNFVPRFDVASFLCDFRVDATICTNEIAAVNGDGEFTVRYDFVYPDYSRSAGSQLRGCVFTEKGRRIYQILLGLGYNLPLAAAVESYGDVEDLDTLSLLPLMAYAKIICDYFCMPAYSDKINSIQAAINTLSTQWASVQNWTGNFRLLCDLIVDLHYSDDLFVSAWDNPVAPNMRGASGDYQIVDLTVNASSGNYVSRVDATSPSSTPSANLPTNGTPHLRANGTNLYPANISQYILNSLQKLSSFLRRNQLAGYRPLDRFLLRYGVKLESEKLKRSVFVNMQRVPINIQTVVSNSDTYQQGGQSLADYAAVAFGKGGSGYTWQSDEFGILIDCAYIMPYVKYFEGVQPQCMQQTRLQFFQPEFDGLGSEAIPAKQLFFSSVNRYSHSQVVPFNEFPMKNETFGFAPRYYGEKTRPWAVVSGDFRCNSRNVGYEQWHLFRFIPTSVLSGVNWKHDQFFTQGSLDAKQYHRCFQITDGMNDPFTIGVHYDVKASEPARPLFDDLILDSDPDAEHQHEININVGGSRHQ